MSQLKAFAILVLSAQLALAAQEINTEEHVIWPRVWKAQEVNSNVQDTDENHTVPSVPVAASQDSNQDKESEQPRAADCSSGSAGLGRLLREAKSILPWSEIQQLIVDSVANDQQVSGLVALQRSEALRRHVANIKQSSEYSNLREYACRQLQLDVTDMWNFINSFISLTKEQVKPSVGEFKGRAGIRGLLQDIRSLLPRQQLKHMYQQLMDQDTQLSTAIQRIKSSEFRQLLRNVRLLPETVQLREQFLNVGVPLAELKEVINVALGWTGNEFGNNGEDIKV